MGYVSVVDRDEGYLAFWVAWVGHDEGGEEAGEIEAGIFARVRCDCVEAVYHYDESWKFPVRIKGVVVITHCLNSYADFPWIWRWRKIKSA